METSRSKQRTLQMVQLAILLALVIVLQLWGSNVKIGPTSFSLVLIPIVIGGILLGLIESLAAGYLNTLTGGVIGSGYKDIFAFVVLIVVLIIRPHGLLGKKTAEKV